MPTVAEKAKAATADRPVMYETVDAQVLDVDQNLVDEMLGWKELEDDSKEPHDIVDYNGKKVQLLNNPENRPITMSWCETLAETILRRRWKLNGESGIIDKYGIVRSFQHRLVAVKLAEQMRTGPDAARWKKEFGWDGPVSIQAVVVTGVEGDDDTINTLDTGRPRSLADVLFRHDEFRKLTKPGRKKAASATDWAIRTLWDRTHAGVDAWAPVRTHPESMAFLANHKRLLKCVKHVLGEDGEDRKLSRLVKPGHASALMYLMASCDSDYEKYDKAKVRREAGLDFGYWDKAMEFWTLLASGEAFRPVRRAIADLGEEGSRDEVTAVIVKAWNRFANGDPLTPKSLEIRYATNDDGVTVLEDRETVGGIDRGPSAWAEKTPPDPDVKPEEAAAEAEKIKAENLASKANGKPKGGAKPAAVVVPDDEDTEEDDSEVEEPSEIEE